MQNSQPTKAEKELLRAIAQNTPPYDDVPSTQQLARILTVSDSSISNRKTALKNKGYLDGQSNLTDKAWEFLKKNTTISTDIPILGQVKAGRTKSNEIFVDMVNDGYPFDLNVPTLKIPDTGIDTDVFALEVIGQSMENELIFEGDYVIVQKFSETEPTPKQGELIVTKYLPFYDETEFDLQELVDSGISEDDLEGPTVKYYYERDGIYRLSWRKGFDDSEYTIVTKYPPLLIGRVIGVYRSIKQMFIWGNRFTKIHDSSDLY